MKIVLVGFKVKEENSVYYKKLDTKPLKYGVEMTDLQLEQALGHLMVDAAKKGAEFVSVRFIP